MNRDDKKRFVIIIIVLSILVIALSSYLIIDKFINKDTEETNDNIENELSQESDDEKNNIVNNNEEKENTLDNKLKGNVYPNGNILNFDKIEEYNLEHFKNVDKTYNKKETISFEYFSEYDISKAKKEEYKIELMVNGNLTITNETKKEKHELLDNVIDLVYINTEMLDATFYLFMLTEDGEVYYYNLSNVGNEDYKVKKMNINNITRFESISYCPLEDAGCCNGIYAVKQNGKYIQLRHYCV